MKKLHRRTAFSLRYPSKCGVKFQPEHVEKNLLLSALKAWEVKNGFGQSQITRTHGVSTGYWPFCKKKVAA